MELCHASSEQATSATDTGRKISVLLKDTTTGGNRDQTANLDPGWQPSRLAALSVLKFGISNEYHTLVEM